MPVWVIQALAALRAAAIGGPGRALTTGAASGIALADPSGGLLPFLPGFLSGGGASGVHRHRRKRLLTAQMKSDISYIAAVMGPSAAKAAMLIAVSKTG